MTLPQLNWLNVFPYGLILFLISLLYQDISHYPVNIIMTIGLFLVLMIPFFVILIQNNYPAKTTILHNLYILTQCIIGIIGIGLAVYIIFSPGGEPGALGMLLLLGQYSIGVIICICLKLIDMWKQDQY